MGGFLIKRQRNSLEMTVYSAKKELDSIAGSLKGTEGIYLTDFNVQVLAEDVPTARLEKRYIALS